MVARRLLGHWLIRNTAAGPCGGAIVEVEAYLRDDPASHGFPGETARNRVMFGAPGHGYVYLIYGYHFCVNAVCRPAGVAEAVLIRAIEPKWGQRILSKNRPSSKTCGLTNGPAKLCEAMNIDRGLDGINLCDASSALFIAQNPQADLFRKEEGPVITTSRIGITKGASLQLRFYLESNKFVSQKRSLACGVRVEL